MLPPTPDILVNGEDDALRRVLTEASRRGFIGPGPIDPHLAHAQGFLHTLGRLLPAKRSKREITRPGGEAAAGDANPVGFCDLGSGGGLPGLPLLVWRPDLHGTLLDAQRRRTRFLEEAIVELGIQDRARVLTGRVEELMANSDSVVPGRASAVVARSFGPPSATLEIATHLVMPKGFVVISEPPTGRRWATAGLAVLGVRRLPAEGANLAVFERIGDPPAPRRWKAMIDDPMVTVTAGR